ncbi:hypothetical protein [Polyangium jinanense]|uniref:Uncharacterized protein n=1 Tax=Polyangium jinanense TaxID=2829994 RepID=A0A9X4AWJ6_9BACT|nr:hypothetical protein [Polyangium jinanense]MDC3960525.1 hypothetical protein [Polyangium jinanense]MDC3985387.1 hypothetical protein [Polyangium jinanense]
MTSPQFDPVKGKQAFEALLPRYQTMPVESLAVVNADAGLAAVAALGLAARASEPKLWARYKSLPSSEFDAALVELLPTAAWACWYAATEDQKARTLSTEGKLPAELVQKALGIEARMQALCEYHLNDHPEVGPYLAMLRAGTGHRDLAADLLGYATVYRDHYDALKDDKKHFRATDADDAVKAAEEILANLGARLGPEARVAADHLARAFTLLLDTYEEVAATGRWLLRHEPTPEKTFPSLYSVIRSRAGGRGKKKPEPPPAGPAGG